MITPGDVLFFIRKKIHYRLVVLWIPKNDINNVVAVPVLAEPVASCVTIDVTLVSRDDKKQRYQEGLPFLFDATCGDYSRRKLERLVSDTENYGNIYLGSTYISNESLKTVLKAACASGMPDDFKAMLDCERIDASG